jgi:molybdopterin synthase catalytic subunit
MTMKIKVKLFARLRELAGTADLDYEVSQNSTVAELLKNLQSDFPNLAKVADHTVVSLNRDFVEAETRLSEGDEVALFPPVSGGSSPAADQGHFAITFTPINLADMQAKVLKAETGAVALFSGVVRNVSSGKEVVHLEYEAYEAMAVAKLRQVGLEARERWPKIVDIAISQRIGHLEVGEIAVVVAVSSPHRGDGCFEACAYAINRLKEIVPIWKKETGRDGSEWIEGDYLPSAADAR